MLQKSQKIRCPQAVNAEYELGVSFLYTSFMREEKFIFQKETGGRRLKLLYLSLFQHYATQCLFLYCLAPEVH